MSQHLTITNDTELHKKIMELSYLKEEQELSIKRNLKELSYAMHPSALFKNLLGKITGDPEAMDSAKSVGMEIGKDFLLSKLFGRKISLKSFLLSFAIRKTTDYIMNNHPDLIANGIHKLENLVSNLVHKKEKE